MGTTQELSGLEIGDYAVKLAQLGGKSHKIHLKLLDREVLPETTSQSDKEQAKIDTIKRLYTRNATASKQVAITIASSTTTVKKIQIPKVAPHILQEAVFWEAEQYLPFDLADFKLDFHLLPEGEEAPYHQLLLVAAPKILIEHTAQLVRQADLQPVIVDIPALALENQYLINYAREEADPVCLIDIGAYSTIINIVCAGNTTLTHTLPIGGNQYTEVIQNKLGVSYMEAESIKQQPGSLSQEIQETLQEVSAKIGIELKQFLNASKIALNEVEIEKIFLSGGGSLSNGLAGHLQTFLAKPVIFLNPLNAIHCNDTDLSIELFKPYLASMAIAIGLGLRCWPRVQP